MESPLDTALLRYDGEERRRAFGQYPGVERRLLDPATEQDHPELFYPPPDELQPQQPG